MASLSGCWWNRGQLSKYIWAYERFERYVQNTNRSSLSIYQSSFVTYLQMTYFAAYIPYKPYYFRHGRKQLCMVQKTSPPKDHHQTSCWNLQRWNNLYIYTLDSTSTVTWIWLVETRGRICLVAMLFCLTVCCFYLTFRNVWPKRRAGRCTGHF